MTTEEIQYAITNRLEKFVLTLDEIRVEFAHYLNTLEDHKIIDLWSLTVVEQNPQQVLVSYNIPSKGEFRLLFIRNSNNKFQLSGKGNVVEDPVKAYDRAMHGI